MSQTTSAELPLQKSNLSATLLVSGACIGGGMLAMPIQTAEAGFFPSILMLALSWVFMTFTGLLLVEATLWMKNSAHFSSLTTTFLGKWGNALCLVVYLFMNYASLVAYTAGGANLLDQWIVHCFGFSIGYMASCVTFTTIFGAMIYLGSIFIGKMNSLLVIAMIFAYVNLVGSGLPSIEPQYLIERSSWWQGVSSVPLLLAAFSYQMIVPSICSYLNYQVQPLKKAIVFGTLVPFVVYAIWLLLIHGLIPVEGAGGLQEAFLKGTGTTDPLKKHFSSLFLKIMADGFAFCALVTSYLSLSLGLFDFIKDALRDVKIKIQKNTITLLSVFPALGLAILYPRALLDFLDMSGGFGDALLSGLIPVALVWVGRKRQNPDASPYTAPGGNTALLITASVALAIFVYQWVKVLAG
ncbi:MAG: amino acid transporter [Chlamydiae bacterium]|nr:amino acid transporter [Chlamydiota bacterium]